MKVRIEDRHLEGRSFIAADCPLHAALQEQYPNETVTVSGRHVAIGSTWYAIADPAALFAFIYNKIPCEVELGPCDF